MTLRPAALLAVSAGLVTSSSTLAQLQIDPVDPVLRAALRRVYPGGGTDTVGPDVIVGEIQNSGDCCPDSETTGISPSATLGSIVAYGLGTSSCNIGSMNVTWVNLSPNHPIIPQNMYRLETVNGSTRLEMLGQSWSKYAFTALTFNVCNVGCNGQGGPVLGVGCSDPYTAGRNATQSSAGPRYECNPFTGVFPDSSAVRAAWPPASTSIHRRLQVNTSDISTAAHPSALFFGECIYITGDDARYGNGKNNASYRRFTVGTGNTIALQGAIGGNGTQRMKPAIYAWQANGLGIGVADPNVMISDVAPPQLFSPPSGLPQGDGWLFVGSKATNIGGGIWHYEFAVENLNSDRGVASFRVNLPAGAIVSNAEMKQALCHSGVAAADASRNAPWTQSIEADNINWTSSNSWNAALPQQGSYIRWGTLCNFRFDCNIAPVNTGSVTMAYFKPDANGPASINATAWTPSLVPANCYANCDGSGAAPVLNANDFQCFLNKFAAGDSYANCDGVCQPGCLTPNDFQCFLNAFSVGCS